MYAWITPVVLAPAPASAGAVACLETNPHSTAPLPTTGANGRGTGCSTLRGGGGAPVTPGRCRIGRRRRGDGATTMRHPGRKTQYIGYACCSGPSSASLPYRARNRGGQSGWGGERSAALSDAFLATDAGALAALSGEDVRVAGVPVAPAQVVVGLATSITSRRDRSYAENRGGGHDRMDGAGR